jgi:hypothetical protein
LRMFLAALLALLYCIVRPNVAAQPPCTLPPDFWCDHPNVTLACTGSLSYCESYKANRAGRKLDLRLAFETACPDSQKFIIYRMYPNVLSQPSMVDMVDFKAYPWGLAKRESDQKVRCHHGQRECIGNRVLSCALRHYDNDKFRQGKVLNCFMSHMMYRGEPLAGMEKCMDSILAAPAEKSEVIGCAKGRQANELEKTAEIETQKILTTPRFVPFISVNGHAHIHMQSYQLMMTEKIQIWNSSVNRFRSPSAARPSQCQSPPDFWCSDPLITSECYNANGCSSYQRVIYGKPLHIRIIYNSQLPNSRMYILHYLRTNVLRNAISSQKVIVELEPTALSSRAQCDSPQSPCYEQALQECVASTLNSPIERTNVLLCLLEAWSGNAATVRAAFVKKCSSLAPSTPQLKDNALKCVESQQWRALAQSRATRQMGLWPEPKRSDPWLVINGYSLSSAQEYARILHRTICLWYRGPGHVPEKCGRCEYEPTHC